MSFARGDLARRAALADNLAVPEPWGANDNPRVFAAIRDLRDEFRQLGITDADGKGRLPDFLLDYENLPPIKPTTLDRAHTRNSAATRWDQNGNLVEDSSDTLRLQRDPKTQAVEGLLYEPKRTQDYPAPTDISDASWDKFDISLTANDGTAKGLSYDSIVENTDTSTGHGFKYNTSLRPKDEPLAISLIAKESGRSYVSIQVRVDNDDTGRLSFPRFWFNLGDGATGSSNDKGDITVIDHSIKDLGEGWYRCQVSIKPNPGFATSNILYGLANGDLVESYDGDGSSGIYVLHTQAEVSREVTTPILDGNATRGADTVNYGFSFPDKTTGVAFSIEQQGGDFLGGGFDFDNINRNVPGPTFGTTSLGGKRHGVLFYEKGVNGVNNDGVKTVTRNTDDKDSDNETPNDETIDRFQVDNNNISYIIRQIAIHRTPHTQAQKDALRDQYLTQG